MSAHEVKNCPFCGVTPPVPVGTKGVWRQHHAVRCGTANCYGNPLNCKTYVTQEEAIAAWNRRAHPAEEVQPVAEFKRVNKGGSGEMIGIDWLIPFAHIPDHGLLYTRPPAADADRLDAERYRKATTHGIIVLHDGAMACVGKPEADAALDAIDAALAASKEKKE